ncbi:MAG: hypothetical protein J6R14_01970, partial [Bacteroidales bacterium]|nr:hypothetical protein [Bacteroidales bacterium]
MITDYADIFASGKDSFDFEEFSLEMMKNISVEPNFDEKFFKDSSAEQLADKIAEAIREIIGRRTEAVIAQAWPIIDHI